ncbi:hypothetical protein RCO48_19735 [Peribacillus frigoritolerans]|nr:hypothetical protein [Peribacillus frigoritolerans]
MKRRLKPLRDHVLAKGKDMKSGDVVSCSENERYHLRSKSRRKQMVSRSSEW